MSTCLRFRGQYYRIKNRYSPDLQLLKSVTRHLLLEGLPGIHTSYDAGAAGDFCFKSVGKDNYMLPLPICHHMFVLHFDSYIYQFNVSVGQSGRKSCRAAYASLPSSAINKKKTCSCRECHSKADVPK